MSQILYHWDSVNFAYAMSEFNVAREQPHPPGYILYVALTRLVDFIFNDPPTTLVVISVISSALAVVLIYCLGKEIFTPAAGLVAAGLLASSPLFWFYGEIGLPHTLDMVIVLVCTLFLYRSMKGDRLSIYLAVIFLAIAGGLRQQTLVFLFPLALFSFRKIGKKHFFLAGFLGFVLCLAWFLPLILLNGGLQDYLGVMSNFSNRFQTETSILKGAGLSGILRNSKRIILYTAYGCSFSFLTIPFFIFRRKWWTQWLEKKEDALFFSLWVLPVLLFYLLIHMGQQGLIFVFLPALFLLFADGLVSLIQNRLKTWIVLFILLGNSMVFLLLPEYPLGSTNQRFLTRETIVHSDEYYKERFNAILENFPAQNSVILAYNWHHVEYYLPGYSLIKVYSDRSPLAKDASMPVFSVGLAQGAVQQFDFGLDSQTGYLVIFDSDLSGLNQSSPMTKQVSLGDAGKLDYIAFDSRYSLVFQGDLFELMVK